jgi:preprotein translocase SecE subunit
MKQFLINTQNELKHVVWPTRARAITYAAIIIVFSLVLGYVLFAFDEFFRQILKAIFIK